MDLALPVHPRTGLQALGIVGGRPVWPVLGGAPDDDQQGQQQGQQAAGATGAAGEGSGQGQGVGERPEGVSEEEWAALGDPGRRAIERERRNAREERRARETAERERDEARRRTTGQSSDQQQAGASAAAGQQAGASGQPDVAAIVEQAVQAALRPVLEQQAATAADRIRDRAQSLAATVLHNPADAAVHLDLARMVTATGDPDEQAIRDGLARLVEERPYLARPVDGRRAAEGSGQGAGTAGGQSLQQRVQAQLELMKNS